VERDEHTYKWTICFGLAAFSASTTTPYNTHPQSPIRPLLKMAPVSNPVVVFNEIPNGAPTDNTLITKSNNTIDLDGPLDGGFLVKTLCFSIDPYQRGKMRDPSITSYTPAYEVGKPCVTRHSASPARDIPEY
jgi:hypothetical protein